MTTDRNLLFGVLALQANLIDSAQFIEACTLWSTRKETSLVDILIERGWLIEADKVHLEYLLERSLQKDDGRAPAGLASVSGDVKRSLAALDDPQIQQSLCGISDRSSASDIAETVAFKVQSDERYELKRLHATGGIGRVWLAYDKALGREVALKDLRPERAARDSGIHTRFLREARITGKLEHPGIIPVYELADRSDRHEPFYTMRFVKGRTLAEAAAEYHRARREESDAGFDLVTLLNAFVTVCKTVAFAHSRNIIHRDLKGQNVVLGDFGEVVLLDWGLAKDVSTATVDEGHESDFGIEDSDNVRLTLDGEAVGTPAYMAPEQAAGQLDQIDQQTDIYGLGAILYEILTGQPPYTGNDTRELLAKISSEEPTPPSQLNEEVPPLLEEACLKALARNSADRHQSATELGNEIERWQENQRREAEEALRLSQKLYQSLVDTLPLCIWRKDLENKFTFANERLCRELGKQPDEVIGKTDFDFYPRELAEKYSRDDSTVIQTGEKFESTEEHVEPGGDSYYVHVVKTPVRDLRGRIIGTQGIYWDVSDLKRAERALRDSEALYRSLVDVLPLILVRKDLEHRFTFANKRFCDDLHTTPDEIMGKNDFDFFSTELAENYQRNDRIVIESGQPLEAEEKYVVDGESVDVRVIKTPLYNSLGEMNGLQLICWDVTELKRTERALRDSEALYKSLVDVLPLILARKDLEGRFTFMNQRACESVGKPLEEILGKTDFDLFPKELAESAARTDREVIESGRPIEYSSFWYPDKGKDRYFRSIKSPVRDASENIIGVQVVIWDVTEQTQLEEELKNVSAELNEARRLLRDRQ